jgi:hypothetical protein
MAEIELSRIQINAWIEELALFVCLRMKSMLGRKKEMRLVQKLDCSSIQIIPEQSFRGITSI